MDGTAPRRRDLHRLSARLPVDSSLPLCPPLEVPVIRAQPGLCFSCLPTAFGEADSSLRFGETHYALNLLIVHWLALGARRGFDWLRFLRLEGGERRFKGQLTPLFGFVLALFRGGFVDSKGEFGFVLQNFEGGRGGILRGRGGKRGSSCAASLDMCSTDVRVEA